MMLPELGGRGSWSRWSNNADSTKFSAPTVEGVDYPSVGLSVARNDVDRGELVVQTYAATPSRTGYATSFRVAQVPDLDNVRVICDGDEFTAWRGVGPGEIELDVTIGDHALLVRTGYHGRARQPSREPAASAATLVTATASARTDGPTAAQGPGAIATATPCSCC